MAEAEFVVSLSRLNEKHPSLGGASGRNPVSGRGLLSAPRLWKGPCGLCPQNAEASTDVEKWVWLVPITLCLWTWKWELCLTFMCRKAFSFPQPFVNVRIIPSLWSDTGRLNLAMATGATLELPHVPILWLKDRPRTLKGLTGRMWHWASGPGLELLSPPWGPTWGSWGCGGHWVWLLPAVSQPLPASAASVGGLLPLGLEVSRLGHHAGCGVLCGQAGPRRSPKCQRRERGPTQRETGWTVGGGWVAEVPKTGSFKDSQQTSFLA